MMCILKISYKNKNRQRICAVGVQAVPARSHPNFLLVLRIVLNYVSRTAVGAAADRESNAFSRVVRLCKSVFRAVILLYVSISLFYLIVKIKDYLKIIFYGFVNSHTKCNF